MRIGPLESNGRVVDTVSHRRQPRLGCIPTNISVGGDINGNVPTNIRGGNVVEYELLIASVKKATLSFKK